MKRSFLLALCSSAALAQDVPLFTSDFPPEEFASRRAALYQAIGESSAALVQGAAARDDYARFRQSNELYYLSGVETPHAYLLLDGAKKKATLFLPHRNEGRERSEGKLLSAEDAETVTKLAGVEAVMGTDLLGEQLARLARGGGVRTLYTPYQPAEGVSMSRDLAIRGVADHTADPWDGRPSREGQLLLNLRTRFPQLELKDLSPALDALRLIKSPRELALIRRATRLACLAILEAMRSTEPGIYEHELDGVSKFVFARNGAQGEAYFSLIASGENVLFGHYNAGKRQLRDGELLLFDHAPDVGYYMSDVTRMWPVNGRWSATQREIYGFYVACYRAILKAIRPGVTSAVVMQEAAREMQAALSRWRFGDPVYEKAAREFVETYAKKAEEKDARLGHWVGMATHDVGEASGPLRAGMVFTIEPELRVKDAKVAIRLEDLVIVTENGREVASDWLAWDMDAIAKVMREEGILQRYPRDKEK